MDLNEAIEDAAIFDFVTNGHAHDATAILTLGIAVLLMVCFSILPNMRFAICAALQASRIVINRIWDVLVHKIIELVLIGLLAWLAGFPTIEFVATLALRVIKPH